MQLTLRHNTTADRAAAIIKSRSLIACVEPGRRYGHNHGPYFFVVGWPSGEVVSGGRPHDANLFFSCNLPDEWVESAVLNREWLSGYAHRRGKLLLCTPDPITSPHPTPRPTFREAIIIPPSDGCLTLTGYKPDDLFDGLFGFAKRRVQRLIDGAAPFSVALPSYPIDTSV